MLENLLRTKEKKIKNNNNDLYSRENVEYQEKEETWAQLVCKDQKGSLEHLVLTAQR